MAPSGQSRTDSPEPERPNLFTPWMVMLCWLPIFAIGASHYATHSHEVWVHNLLRRAYYIPIVLAAFHGGLRGGLLASVTVSLTYLPHAFLHLGHLAHSDPGNEVDKAIELVLYNALGALGGYLSDKDRKRRRSLETALEEQQRLRQQLVRAGRLSALGEVIAGVAHEIKNPLHALQGTAEIIDPLIPVSAEERHLWEVHVSELGRLRRIAERFLSFATPTPLDFSSVDLRDVPSRLVSLLGAEARKRQVEMILELPRAPVLVHGDRDQLAQVAMNICLNAMRAISHMPGTILLCVESAPRNATTNMHRLRIENDGPLIPTEDLEKLFDPFHGTDPEGSGLGLSISARIVEQHGGYIEVKNAGLGVSFDVFLPAAAERASRSRSR